MCAGSTRSTEGFSRWLVHKVLNISEAAAKELRMHYVGPDMSNSASPIEITCKATSSDYLRVCDLPSAGFDVIVLENCPINTGDIFTWSFFRRLPLKPSGVVIIPNVMLTISSAQYNVETRNGLRAVLSPSEFVEWIREQFDNVKVFNRINGIGTPLVASDLTYRRKNADRVISAIRRGHAKWSHGKRRRTRRRTRHPI